ncbi:zinc dependent phospholipase C family protein [Desulfonatronum parangueonense]
MIIKCLFVLICLLVIPSSAWAWGPLTHIYVASELFAYASIIPPAIFGLLSRYRQDFLYGNLMADMILGKSHLPEDKSPHSWATGMRFLEHAQNESEQAFAYGYLCHLAADTVAHRVLLEEQQDVSHAWLEMQADAMIHKAYWLQSVSFSRAVQRRNDRFLENSLDSYIFSFKTNRRIYKSFVFLSLLNFRRKKTCVTQDYIHELHDHSLARMICVLRDGEKSLVLQENPMAAKPVV